MKIFFDVLLYLDCVLTIVLLSLALMRWFPLWVKRIDPEGNKKNKPPERYMENSFVFLELRLIIIVLVSFFIALLCFFLGSTPKEMENPGLLLFIPVLILLVGTGAGCVLLGEYFNRIARKNNIFRKTGEFPTAYVRSRSQFGVGAIISFYFFLIIFFALTDLFFIAGLI